MKSTIKSVAVLILMLPLIVAQRIASILGLSHFIMGGAFDKLLVNKTVSHTSAGDITFHTPNWLTVYRAKTLLQKEPETIAWLNSFEPHAIFWDVGANVGVYSLYAATRHRGLKVYAFEPSIENTYLLNRNISENGLSQQITAVPVALSNANGPNLFRHQKVQFGGALNSFGVDYSHDGKPAKFTNSYTVFGFRADDVGRILGIGNPNYLKVDVDGIEHLIAEGAREILSSPALHSVLIELNSEFHSQYGEVKNILAECGLSLVKRSRAEEFYDDNMSGICNHIFIRDEVSNQIDWDAFNDEAHPLSGLRLWEADSSGFPPNLHRLRSGI